jgi:CRISPR-associated endoribonuclease Cas6
MGSSVFAEVGELMRIELILDNPRSTRIPINYSYPLAACIYNTLGASSADYADRLHDHGYQFKGKHFKLFTFSQLLAPRCRPLGDQLLIQADTIRWLVSSPVDDFVRHFANGILDRGHVSVHETNFPIREVRTVAEPIFSERMRFRCLSPITVSTHTDAPGLNRLQYCRLEDGFYEKIADNLRRKQALLNGILDREYTRMDTNVGGRSGVPAATGNNGHNHRDAENTERKDRHSELVEESPISAPITPTLHNSNTPSFSMFFDPLVIASKQGRIHKLITYKDTKIFCYQCPFTAEGAPELMRIGYQCGFGDGNSKGFGMVEVCSDA